MKTRVHGIASLSVEGSCHEDDVIRDRNMKKKLINYNSTQDKSNRIDTYTVL